MGQSDIVEWLRCRRLTGDHRFYTRQEIVNAQKALGYSGNSSGAQLDALYLFKYLDVRADGISRRRYRLKAKYVNEGVRLW